jgi:hypothetical protein
VRSRAVLLGLLALGAGTAAAAPPNPKATSKTNTKQVTGKAVLTTSICGGGAAIRQEDVDRLPPPQPIGGREFLVVAGERTSAAQPAARFVTRADGTFVTRLPPGRWCFFEAARRPKDDRPEPLAPAAPNVDPGCLAAEKRRCDLVLAVTSDVRQVEITFTQGCPQVWNQPCYRGPMPP